MGFCTLMRRVFAGPFVWLARGIQRSQRGAALFWASVFVMVFCAPQALNTTMVMTGWRWDENAAPAPAALGLAPLFTNQIDYWSHDLVRWSDQYDLDPNLFATVMQIESCGHPSVVSRAGAQGLFQVMPFHFSTGEDMIDPNTNAFRAANFLNYCLTYADGDTGLAMACYNGGPSVVKKAMDRWPAETQRYYTWGVGIYADAQASRSDSDTLNRWLSAGGQSLCNMADVTQQQRT